MTTALDDELFALLTRLKDEWPSRAWGWDGRLPTITSSFDAATGVQARAIVDRLLPQPFTAETLATAPEAVREIVERSGGLRGSQLAFCGGPPDRLAFGLWWPWGGGGTISLRLGLVVASPDAAGIARLRELFKIES